ncbi:PQQ-dependent sugar dehydrogenase [Pedococcus sp. NPDC057267]|uniref:PQQ-dependent sugar dehydrogenase n=1 Tax=Pedococcus sp. NPDC057267 TaxID=3346077 RepID=UPI003624DA64
MPPHPTVRATRALAAASAAVVALVVASGCSGSPAPDGRVTGPSLATTSAATAGTSGTTPLTGAGPSTGARPSSGTSSPTGPGASRPAVVTVAQDLDVPWSVAFLPDGSALVTLRDRAQLLHVREGSAPVVLGTVPGVAPAGEGGLLGVAVSPTFSRDHRVFVYYTGEQDNRVVRLTFTDGRATSFVPVLTGIPKAGIHNGGRLAFGPDGYLYVTTGDAGNRPAAQDKSALGGKILRVTQDGGAAPGNPFGTRVWSYGHRNVQGIAWAPDGRMYASEFGQDTWDELNLIQPGRNYGWPVVEGKAARGGYTDPLVQWPTSQASPSGIAVADGAVWMAALRGRSLWRIPLQGNGVGAPQRLLDGTYGRLRDVVDAGNGRLWVVTSNTFRGTPGPHDDRILDLAVSSLR